MHAFAHRAADGLLSGAGRIWRCRLRGADGTRTPGRVLYANSPLGIHPDEITVAELLQDAGYATGIIGKWHFGDAPQFNPLHHGFDEFFGVPYSNDMDPYYYLRGTERLAEPVDRDNQTRRYTDEAIAFIRKHRDKPFFLFVAHTMPHTPLAVSQEFRGKSQRGPFGDAVTEVDWSAGQILNALRELQLDQQHARDFLVGQRPVARARRRRRLGQSATGRQRHHIRRRRARAVHHVVAGHDSTRNYLPRSRRNDGFPADVRRTRRHQPPTDRTIDGHDIRPLLTDDEAKSPWEALYYYFGNELHGVRSGPWKFRPQNNLLNENIYNRGASTSVNMPPALYNLDRDPGEQKSVMQQHPDIVTRMRGYLKQARDDLGDSLRGIAPTNARPIGQVEAGGTTPTGNTQ